MKFASRFFVAFFCLFSLLALPAAALGQQNNLELQYPQLSGAPTITSGSSMADLIVYLYRFSLVAGAGLAVASLIYAGIIYITAADNVNRLAEAKGRMVAAILGLLILFGSYVVLAIADPQLVIIKIKAPIAAPVPKAQEAITPASKPKSFSQITSFEQNTKSLIHLLQSKISVLDAVFFAATFMPFYNNLQWLQKRDCGQTRTFCAPDGLSPRIMSCKWERENIKEKIMDTINKDNLSQFRKIIEALAAPIEARKLKGTTAKISGCLSDLGAKMEISGQAKENGNLNYFNIGASNPLYFYCFR